MRHYIVGNGPSVNHRVLLSLRDGKVWTVNRIWRLWMPPTGRAEFIDLWRPDFYVRAEVPMYEPKEVEEDLAMMGSSGAKMYLQEGFKGRAATGYVTSHTKNRTSHHFFHTCSGKERHAWHPQDPLELLYASRRVASICGYGTVVTIAAQLAAFKEEATEIVFVGCELGNKHFYDDGFKGADLALAGHRVAEKCSPIPIYEGLLPGQAPVLPYPKVDVPVYDYPRF